MLHKMRWTSDKIAQRLKLIEPLVYRRRHDLPAFHFKRLNAPADEPPVQKQTSYTDWKTIEPNTYWEGPDVNFVLHTQFDIPNDWDASQTVALYFPLGYPGSFSHPEALVYVDGVPYATCDRHHQEIVLKNDWRDGQAHWLALHGWTGNEHQAGPNARLLMETCQVVQIDQPTRDFIATARVAQGIAKTLGDNDQAKNLLLNALNDAFKILDTHEPIGEHFYESVAEAHAILKAGIAQSGSPMDIGIVATGHAHIDVAWLWTLDQVRRKSGRTFHTVMRLMEQFPEYHFTQSQPQLYDYVKHDYPELFEAIKQRIAEGRWEPIGGMWVEADCNISGSESLARQFLLGRDFFRKHFGAEAESPVLWLPDVFGYAWNLPQLIKEAGMEYFFTIKIGWSLYNRLPYDTFWWQGLDGTKVLTHFSTTKEVGSQFAATYNSNASPTETVGTWVNFQQKEIKQDLLMSYGYGDGGGGPNREMLENIREMGTFPSTPRIRQGAIGDFFNKLETEHGSKLPTWNGELYLEIHRGTYTTQSRNKRANRKSEFMLHDAEFLATLAANLDPAYTYPQEVIHKAWELVCLNQFHDIIPGSSINQVYVDSQKQYEEIREKAESVKQHALDAIAKQSGGDVILVNPTTFQRHDLAFWEGTLAEGEHLQTSDGKTVAVQPTSTGSWIAGGDIEAHAVVPLKRVKGSNQKEAGDLTASPTLLENNYVRVELNAAGDITRIFDKANHREVLPPEKLANQFQAFEDRPVNWDAWDIDIFYDDRVWASDPATSVKVVEEGPLRATIEIHRRILQSEYVQRISLAYNSPRLDFDTQIEWRERHILLKVAFPVDVLTPLATHEIQWGNVQRATHRNTSWDWARFETCAQKWVDLSEGDYGVSLLNDCKYGHDIRDNVIRLSLLRSPTSPDPEADQGSHRFAYSLLPHSGDWTASTAAEAYALNDPLIAATGAGKSELQSIEGLVKTDQNGIIIETVKQAEDGNGIIVRFYQSQRRRSQVTLTTRFEIGSVWRTNILEDNQHELESNGKQTSLFVTPYQIVTIRLVPK